MDRPRKQIRIKAEYKKVTLDFKFGAGTSRGVLRQRTTYWIKVYYPDGSEPAGYGEAGPLPLLSEDDIPEFEDLLSGLCDKIEKVSIPEEPDKLLIMLKDFVPANLPSIRFAMETAVLDLLFGGKRRIMENTFFDGGASIPINGLIWMGSKEFMLEQIHDKLEQGFSCIKMKIGAIDFGQECELLAYIREKFSSDKITLRVDANGAFTAKDAFYKLDKLAEYDLHSIEQPVKAGQWELMKLLCEQRPLPVALDEELIGVYSFEDRKALLETIQPAYIILKPTLVGGILSTMEWIELAESLGIGWWITSALESNIGLNAISQLTSVFRPGLPQGLGTGQLYHNNIDSPLRIRSGAIYYDRKEQWGDFGF